MISSPGSSCRAAQLCVSRSATTSRWTGRTDPLVSGISWSSRSPGCCTSANKESHNNSFFFLLCKFSKSTNWNLCFASCKRTLLSMWDLVIVLHCWLQVTDSKRLHLKALRQDKTRSTNQKSHGIEKECPPNNNNKYTCHPRTQACVQYCNTFNGLRRCRFVLWCRDSGGRIVERLRAPGPRFRHRRCERRSHNGLRLVDFPTSPNIVLAAVGISAQGSRGSSPWPADRSRISGVHFRRLSGMM